MGLNIKSRVVNLERAKAAIERERWLRDSHYQTGARFLSDAELETVIFQQTGIPPAELSDEMLGRIARGEV
jgi:hypothetical protein